MNIKLNEAAIAALTRSPEVQQEVRRRAENVRGGASENVETIMHRTPGYGAAVQLDQVDDGYAVGIAADGKITEYLVAKEHREKDNPDGGWLVKAMRVEFPEN